MLVSDSLKNIFAHVHVHTVRQSNIYHLIKIKIEIVGSTERTTRFHRFIISIRKIMINNRVFTCFFFLCMNSHGNKTCAYKAHERRPQPNLFHLHFGDYTHSQTTIM